MKKLLLFVLLIGGTQVVFAQKTDSLKKSGSLGNNEIRLNLLNSILGLPEINYERIIADDMGVGLAVFAGVDDETDFAFGVIPHVRVYFGNKKAAGFFVEGNAALVSVKSSYFDYSHLAYTTYPAGTYPEGRFVETTNSVFGLGAAAGGKFITKNGFIGGIYGGLGRLFGNSNLEVYPRVGITIGKRF